MINYRIDNMAEMLAELQRTGSKSGRALNHTRTENSRGSSDPDGNKVELWEPMLWDESNTSK